MDAKRAVVWQGEQGQKRKKKSPATGCKQALRAGGAQELRHRQDSQHHHEQTGPGEHSQELAEAHGATSES